MKLRTEPYFRLRPECYLIKGIRKGALYNLLTGEILSLFPLETGILASCEKNETVDVTAQALGVPPQVVLDFLHQLEDKHMGIFLEKPAYIEKYRDSKLYRPRSFLKDHLNIQTAFLQLSDHCDLDCSFCRNETTARRWECMGCTLGPKTNKKSLSTEEILDVLHQLDEMDCPTVFFRGGNLFLDMLRLTKVLNQARQMKFKNIFLATHGVSFSKEHYRILAEYRLHPVLQVLPPNREIYAAITGNPDNLDRLLSAIKKLQDRNIPFSLCVLGTECTVEQLKAAGEFYSSFSPAFLSLDVLIMNPEARGVGEHQRLVREFLMLKRQFPRTYGRQFFNRQQFHSCLYGKIAIDGKGDILPCPSMRDDVLGNIQEKKLHEIFSEERIDLYWELTKEKVRICRTCEFRYACDECRALEKRATGDLYGIKFCSYNPKTGE